MDRFPFDEDEVETENFDDIEEDSEFTMKHFEVSSEIVDDFSYYYKDEEQILANERLKRKYRIVSALIVIALLFIVITAIGGIRMATYKTTDIVTKQLIAEIEFMEDTEDIYYYCLDFYNKQENSGYYYDAINNNDKLTQVQTELETHYNTIYSIQIPVPTENENYTNYIGYKSMILEALDHANKLLDDSYAVTLVYYDTLLQELSYYYAQLIELN